MTPEHIQAWLDQHSHRMDNPAQYIGTEPNTFRKPWDSVSLRYLLAASWPYFHSAGNQSIPAVYQAINDHPDCLADLSYLPETPRDMRMLERSGIPVFGIESKHPMRDFDVVGTSISYMVLFVNFVHHLQMSGIPLRWREREAAGLENFPMVMVGGQAFCAPGAMEPVVDCVWLGEVEDEPGNGGISEVSDRIIAFKQAGLWSADRLACYESLAREFNYLYFPRFVQVEYRAGVRGLEHPSKQVSGYRSVLPGMRLPFRARHVIDMDAIKPLRAAPLLFTSPSMGAGDLEVARGCPAWCGFCRLSWVTKPYRQRDVGMTVGQAQVWKRNMGSVELSPFAPDFPMHTRKKELLSRLLQEVGDELDTTALRIDDFIGDEQYVLLQAVGGADTITLGLEGNSQRMRDLVGKGTSDREAEQALVTGIRAGFRKFKFFMINNFPGESDADVRAIIRLGQRLAQVRDELGQPNVVIQFSWTPLLIEAQTPFQWFAPTPPDHRLIEVIDQLRDCKIETKIGTKAEPNKIALFQLCQRASRDVGEAIVDVLETFGTATWGGVPKDTRERLEEALRAHGFANGLADCFDERGEHDLFGWEFIDTGASQQLMWRTYRQMVEFLQGTDGDTYDQEMASEHYHGQEFIARCDTSCEGAVCGACKPADYRKRREYIQLAEGEPSIDLSQLQPVDESTVACKVVMRLHRRDSYRFVGNEHWRYAVRRAAYRAQESLPFGIAKRSIRFASDGIKHKDWAIGTDYCEFGLTEFPDLGQGNQFMERVQAELQLWLEVQEWGFGTHRAASMTTDATALYSLELDAGLDTVRACLAAWEAADYVKLRLVISGAYFGTGAEEVNAKDLVHDMWAVQRGHQLFLRMLVTGGAGPYQVAACLLGKPSWLDLAQYPVHRLDWLMHAGAGPDLLLPECPGCGAAVPVNLLDELYGEQCPRCRDISKPPEAGRVVAALSRLQAAPV